MTTKDFEDQPVDNRETNAADAVDRYLAGNAADDDATADQIAAVFARCDAVIALTPKLAAHSDVGWAFAEARELARSDPRGQTPSRRLPWHWLSKPGIAWGAAGFLAVALVVAVQPRSTQDAAPGDAAIDGSRTVQSGPAESTSESLESTPQPTVQNFTFAPIVISTELAQALAEVRPVVLLANQTAVDSRSLAVMPFTASAGSNLRGAGVISADSIYTQVYRQLAAIPGLYLIDPGTAAVYAGSDLTANEIAQQLGVRGILEGNVDSINGSIHFSLNFTDAATAGSSINQSIERPAAEAAFLQSDIASSVLGALARTLPPEPLEQLL